MGSKKTTGPIKNLKSTIPKIAPPVTLQCITLEPQSAKEDRQSHIHFRLRPFIPYE